MFKTKCTCIQGTTSARMNTLQNGAGRYFVLNSFSNKIVHIDWCMEKSIKIVYCYESNIFYTCVSINMWEERSLEWVPLF